MNSDSRNGVQPRPSRPIVCMTMPSMKSMIASTRLRTPLGATSGSRREAMKSRIAVISVASDGDQRDLVERREEILPADDLVDRRELQGEHRSPQGVGAVDDGLEAGVGQRGGHVAELPDQEHEVGDDDGQAERQLLEPAGVADQEHGEEDQAEAQHVAAEHRAHEEGQRDGRRPRDQRRRQQEVDEHDGDRVAGRDGAVDAPERAAARGSAAGRGSTRGGRGHAPRSAPDGGRRPAPAGRRCGTGARGGRSRHRPPGPLAPLGLQALHLLVVGRGEQDRLADDAEDRERRP